MLNMGRNEYYIRIHVFFCQVYITKFRRFNRHISMFLDNAVIVGKILDHLVFYTV